MTATHRRDTRTGGAPDDWGALLRMRRVRRTDRFSPWLQIDSLIDCCYNNFRYKTQNNWEMRRGDTTSVRNLYVQGILSQSIQLPKKITLYKSTNHGLGLCQTQWAAASLPCGGSSTLRASCAPTAGSSSRSAPSRRTRTSPTAGSASTRYSGSRSVVSTKHACLWNVKGLTASFS